MLMVNTDSFVEKLIAAGYVLAATATTNLYAGKAFWQVLPYSGCHGDGYTITRERKTDYYVAGSTKISRSVYAGKYAVKDAINVAKTVCLVDWHGVLVLPTWELELDVIDGSTCFHRIEASKPTTLAGRWLKICWIGEIDEKILRAKIRRKMRLALKSGKAVLI